MRFAKLALFNGFAYVYGVGATAVFGFVKNSSFARIGLFKADNPIVVMVQ